MKRTARILACTIVLSSLLIAALTWRSLAAPLAQTGSIEGAPERPIYAVGMDWAPLEEAEAPEQISSPASWSDVPFSTAVYEKYVGSWDIYNHLGLPLSSDPAVDIYPRLNRGGNMVVFSSNRSGNYEIYTMLSTGVGLTRLTWTDTDDVCAAWSPDGQKIVFETYRDQNPEIYLMNADGTGLTRLTADADYDGMPSWSPDGSKIAFVSRRTGGYRVYTMNPDGGGVTQLSLQPYSAHPVWSPDGSQIAYDADSNGDGGQELWAMNADGSNPRMVYQSSNIAYDAWANSWSPDGQYIVFQYNQWAYTGSEWIWQYASIVGKRLSDGDSMALTSGWVMDADWQTTDTIAPVTSMAVLPAQSPADFTVSWSGSDVGGSGVKYYDVQVRDGLSGAWTDWHAVTTTVSAEFTGVGGHTYYFRTRAQDSHFNTEAWPPDYDTFTMVEAYTPHSRIEALPDVTIGTAVPLHWSGKDLGDSGVASYRVQYRDGLGGSWTDWYASTTLEAGFFSGLPGHTYYFRVQAVDRAQNLEAWPAGEGDAVTTLYSWGSTGSITDLTGVPVAGAGITVSPGAVEIAQSDVQGGYIAYSLQEEGLYTVTWEKGEYGELPPTEFDDFNATPVNIVLPPENNLISDWGFESGEFGGAGWAASGSIPPQVISITRHSGESAAALGPQGWTFADAEHLGNSDEFVAALGPDGSVHVMWNSGGKYYATLSPNGEWSTPEMFTNMPFDGGSFLFDQNGVLHILWLRQDGTGGHFYHCQRSLSGEWSTPEEIYGYEGWNSRSQQFKVFLTHNNKIGLVWPDGGFRVRLIIQTDQGWSEPQVLIQNTYSYPETPIVDKAGIIHILFTRGSGGKTLSYMRSNGLDGWSPAEGIVSLDEMLLLIGYAVDDLGYVHVAYSTSSGTYYLYRPPDGNWSTPEPIPGAGVLSDSSESSNPRIGFVGDDLYLTWKREISGECNVGSIWRDTQGNWSEQQTVSVPYHCNNMPLQTAVAEDKTLHVAWVGGEWYTLVDHLYYATQAPGGVWSAPVEVVPESTKLADVRMMVGPSHQIHFISLEDNELYTFGPRLSAETGVSEISQVITVPVTMTNPTLSFLYQLDGNASSSGETGLSVVVEDGLQPQTLFTATTPTDGWEHAWMDLTPWLSQTITLTFGVNAEQGLDFARVYVDEITIGSAQPDLGLDLQGSGLALPGEQVVYTLSYFNRGGANAEAVMITNTLPAEMSFVSASVPPVVNGSTLIWEIGDVLAQGGEGTIVVTVTLSGDAFLGDRLQNIAVIHSATPEIEATNNRAEAEIFVGRNLYLPFIQRR